MAESQAFTIACEQLEQASSLERIEARGTGPDFTMPPSGGPNEEQVRIFEEWLTCGVRPDAEALEAE